MPLRSSSWPFSWSKVSFIRLFVLSLALIASPSAWALTAAPGEAANNIAGGAIGVPPALSSVLRPSDGALILNNRQAVYNLQGHLYYTRDTAGDLGVREVYLRHRNNLRGTHLPPGPVDLSFDPVQHWFVLDIVNESHKSDWILDFGAMSDGRYGLAPQIYIHDGSRGLTLVDTASGKNPQGHTLPLRLMPKQQMTMVIYVVPSDHAPFVLAPRIIEAAALVSGDVSIDETNLQNVILILIAGAAVFFIGGMFLRRGIGFFPHVLFFISQGIWFWFSGGHIFAAVPGGEHLSGVAMASGALLALAITQSILASQDGEASDSLLLYICASFIVLAVMLFVFLVPENSYLRLGIIGGATGLGYIVAAFKALSINKDLRWSGRAAGIAWILMLWAACLPYVVAFKFMPMSVSMLQAPLLVMPLVCMLMVLSGAAYIRAGNITLVRDILRQTQRAQTMSKLKHSKETADQARFVRAIEHERKIMEDLRLRDAERTEEMRLAKITADEANRAKSAFLAVVSHEIRTPMTGIMGMIRLLLDTPMTREQKDYAQTIQDSGDAMMALLNDILDFSKIEGGGMNLEVIDFDLHRLVASVAMLMNGDAAQRGLTLNIDIDVDAPRFLKGDPTRLRQVFLNLVGNAIKFTIRGGVTIRLRAGDPGIVPSDKTHLLPVTCSVEDTGVGISEEGQKNLFSPFAQADSSIARKFGGTGLGLAICKRLIEAMGSEIQLYSVEGQGTVFTFTLMLPPGDQKAAHVDGREEFAAAARVKPMDILVIDDNAVNRKVMEGLLGRDGHRIVSAPGGREGLAALANKPFQLVFLDIEMPEMNGFAVMEQIRRSEDLRVQSTPVVALTGNVSEEDKERYRAAGMRDTVAKPIDPERLRNILLAHGRAAVPRIEAMVKATSGMELTEDELDEDSFSGSVEYAVSDMPPVAAPQRGSDMPDMPADPLVHTEASLPLDHSLPADYANGYVPMPPQDVVSSPPIAPAGPASYDERLFNVPSITSLSQSLGAGQLAEMLEGVFAHNKAVLPTLQTAFTEGDMETLRGCAHELKGMNGNFGLSAIAELTAAIERAARHGDIPLDRLDDIVFNDLPQAMAETEAAFRNG